MKRPRSRGGKRVFVLFTYALSLTAEDDIAQSPVTASSVDEHVLDFDEQQQQQYVQQQAGSQETAVLDDRRKSMRNIANRNNNNYIDHNHPSINHALLIRPTQTKIVESITSSEGEDDDNENDTRDWNEEVVQNYLASSHPRSMGHYNETPLMWDSHTGMWIDDWTLVQQYGEIPFRYLPILGGRSNQVLNSDNHQQRNRGRKRRDSDSYSDNGTTNEHSTMHSATNISLDNVTGRINNSTTIREQETSAVTTNDRGSAKESAEQVQASDSVSEVIQQQQNEAIVESKVDSNIVAKSEVIQNEAKPSPSSSSSSSSAKVVEVDYASKSAGALILEQSNNFQGTSNLLVKDKDRYAIVPCNEPEKFVIIGLSEDILVKSVVLANYERYSSHTKEFSVAGRSTTVGEWNDMGTYIAQPIQNKQTFQLHNPTWARYLKIQFLTHYGDEDYCTMSQISVHGSTMLQGFHEQWGADSNEQDQDNHVSHQNTSGNADEENNGNIAASAVTAATGPPVDSVNTVTDASSLNCSNGVCDGIDSYLNSSDSLHSFTESCDASYNNILNFCPSEVMDHFEMRMSLLKTNNLLRITQYGDSSGNVRYEGKLHTGGIVCNSNDSDCTDNISAEESDSDSAPAATEDGVVVERIKKLIRTTAGAVDEIGNSLLQRATTAAGIVAENNQQPQQQSTHESSDDMRNSKRNVQASSVKQSDSQSVDTVVSKKDGAIEQRQQQSQAGTEKRKEMEDATVDPRNAETKTVIGESNAVLTNALAAFPSARCLDRIDLVKFKQGLQTTRTGGAGAQSSSVSGNAMEPIFKKLTDEIKALQANMAVHDQYTRDAAMCYQSIILELVMEIESNRAKQEIRIAQLEHDIQAGTQWFNGSNFVRMKEFYESIRCFIESKLVPVLYKVYILLSAWALKGTEVMRFIVFDKQSTIAATSRWFLSCSAVISILYKMGLRIVWRPPSERDVSSSRRKVISPLRSQNSTLDDHISITSVSYIEDTGGSATTKSQFPLTNGGMSVASITPTRTALSQKRKKPKNKSLSRIPNLNGIRGRKNPKSPSTPDLVG